MDLICAYVVMFPACSCRCCCSGPFVSLSSAAILTASGSSVLLSCSYLDSWNSQVAKLSSNFCSSHCGFSSHVRYPMLLVPGGMEYLECISRHVSKPLPCVFCLQIADAGALHVLTKMLCKLLLSCVHCSAKVLHSPVALGLVVQYAVILCFHSSKVLHSPVNRGGDIFWILSSCCSCRCCCCCAAMLLTMCA